MPHSVEVQAGPLASSEQAAAEEIYREAFPPELRVTFGELTRPGRWWVLAHDEGELAGFAVVLDLQAAGCALLEYLAVRDDLRNLGIGGSIVEAVVTGGARRGLKHLLVESEPADAHDPFARRRLAFYARHYVVPHSCVPVYEVPDQQSPGDAVPLTLLHRAMAPTAPRLEGQPLRDALVAVWVRSYGATADDSRLVRCLERLRC